MPSIGVRNRIHNSAIGSSLMLLLAGMGRALMCG